MARRSRRFPAATALLTLLVAIVPARPVAADDVADKKAEAARLAAQLEEQGERISVLAEQLNEIRIEAARRKDEAEAAKAELARADARAKAVQARVRTQAVQAYVRGGTSAALQMLLDTDVRDDLGVRTTYVGTVVATGQELLGELRSAKVRLDAQREAAESASAEADDAAAGVEKARDEAATAARAQEAVLAEVKGELAELVAAEQERRAADEARRVQAELAERRQREAAEAQRRATSTTASTTTTTRPGTTTRPSGGVTSTTVRPTTTTARPTTTTTTRDEATPGPGPKQAPGASTAVAEAKKQIGKPYEWGGSGPDSFDCSGLTAWAWKAGGRTLPHSSRSQWSATVRVSVESLLPGDLLFYGDPIHHVGIYVGNGQMVEASQTGTPVRYASIYRKDMVGAGRVT